MGKAEKFVTLLWPRMQNDLIILYYRKLPTGLPVWEEQSAAGWPGHCVCWVSVHPSFTQSLIIRMECVKGSVNRNLNSAGIKSACTHTFGRALKLQSRPPRSIRKWSRNERGLDYKVSAPSTSLHSPPCQSFGELRRLWGVRVTWSTYLVTRCEGNAALR